MTSAYRKSAEMLAAAADLLDQSEIVNRLSLDLMAPGPDTLARAAETIERARAFGPVLVCCALGYSRSAAAIATWGLRTGRYASLDAAIASLGSARPRIILDEAARAAILAAATR